MSCMSLTILLVLIFGDFAVFQKFAKMCTREKIRQMLIILENFDMQSLVSVLSCEKRI